MTATQATLNGRREAEKLMVTRCEITRDTGEVITDPITGIDMPAVSVVYEGKCKIRLKGGVKDAAIPGMVLAVQQLELSLPVDQSADVRNLDVMTVTTNPLDLALVGKKFNIKGQQAQSYATARRFEIEGTN
ncbi:hypothetical protein IWX78_000334 [Mycetocola sp. CAN_C7]|uniref:DUF6093 family protein n=1 Tax=Mycetocola sp. CAN_C7 TaxID=2787724 RepID=UPI0018CB0693